MTGWFVVDMIGVVVDQSATRRKIEMGMMIERCRCWWVDAMYLDYDAATLDCCCHCCCGCPFRDPVQKWWEWWRN